MTVRPILFSAPMVRALLEGRKTVTRRVLKAQPGWDLDAMLGPEWFSPAVANKKTGELEPGPEVFGIFSDCGEWGMRLPYTPGDLLYVREAWRAEACYEDTPPRDIPFDACCVLYDADGVWSDHDPMTHAGRFRQGMHMPRWASRLTLRVTEVKVERVQDISEADAKAEGVTQTVLEREYFRDLWDSLNEKRGFGWDVNPWVVAVSFEVIAENVDAVLKRHPQGDHNG